MLIEEMRMLLTVFLLGTTDYNRCSEDAEQQYHTDDDEPSYKYESDVFKLSLIEGTGSIKF